MSERFEVAFDWEVEEGVEMPLRVFGTRSKFYPAVTNRTNEDSLPAEGGELEDLQVFSGARLPRDLEKRLIDDERFREKVEESL